MKKVQRNKHISWNAEKRGWLSHYWFSFCVRLVERIARDFWHIHRARWSEGKVAADYTYRWIKNFSRVFSFARVIYNQVEGVKTGSITSCCSGNDPASRDSMSSHPSPEEIFLSERNEGRIWVQGNDENRAQGIDGVLLKQYFNVRGF